MKNILMAMILLLTGCVSTGDIKPAPPSEKDIVHTQFCQATQDEAEKIGQQLQYSTPGIRVEVDTVSCTIFADSLGKATFMIHTYLGDTLVYDMEVVRIMARQNGGWAMVNQGPIYLIDYMNGRIVWFIEQQAHQPEPGSEI